MAKKKITQTPSDIAWEPPPVSDNNPDGPSNLPNYDLKGYRHPEGKMFMPGFVAEGESPNKGDINHVTANGVSSSKGQGHNNAYRYWKGNSGVWNENTDWDGGNLTGM